MPSTARVTGFERYRFSSHEPSMAPETSSQEYTTGEAQKRIVMEISTRYWTSRR